MHVSCLSTPTQASENTGYADHNAGDSRHLDFEEQEYWEGSGEELEMHEDDEEADMRTQEELMMQHRYMMVSLLHF